MEVPRAVQEGLSGNPSISLSDESTVFELCNDSEHVVQFAFLDYIKRTFSAQELVWREQPKMCLARRIDLREFANQPIKLKEQVAVNGMRLNMTSAPSRNGFWCRT